MRFSRLALLCAALTISAVASAQIYGVPLTSGGGGGGSVSTFSSGNLSPLFSTSVATPTTTPAQTFTLTNAAQNALFAGPCTGGTGAPSYRALCAADLPLPTLTTVGGVQSTTSVTHQFLTAINTSGVVSQAQPACGDLSNAVASCSTDTTVATNITSGTLPAAQLPIATSSALGGVKPDGTTISNTSGAIAVNLSNANTWLTSITSGTTGTATVSANFPSNTHVWTGSYWATGAVAAPDSWSAAVSLPTAGLNSPSYLNFTHSGSTSSLIGIQVPSLLLPTTGTAAAPQIIFGSTATNSIWQNAGGILFSTASSTNAQNGIFAASIRQVSTNVYGWTSVSTTVNANANDTGLSRLAPGSIAIGNGTASDVSGKLTSGSYLTGTNCSSSAAPAVCGSSASGSVVVAAAATTVVVNTTAVTANSQVQVTEDSSLGTKLSVTCNTTPATAPPVVTARTGGTSFTITTTTPTTNPRCFSYSIVN